MAIDHSSCDHPRTPAGRRACRALHEAGARGVRNRARDEAAQGKPGGATAPARGDHTGGTVKARQRRAQPRQQATDGRVPRSKWGDVPVGTVVRVEHVEPWGYPVGELVAPIRIDGWASVDLGTVVTRARGPVWLGVRHVPYHSITKIFKV